jgi:hypothetical protein
MKANPPTAMVMLIGCSPWTVSAQQPLKCNNVAMERGSALCNEHWKASTSESGFRQRIFVARNPMRPRTSLSFLS